MQNIEKTRFLAANYSNLQGLKSVPLGLLLVMIVIATSGDNSRPSALLLPIGLSIAMLILFLAIRRYYLKCFGMIDRTVRQKRLEFILGGIGGVLGLAAFALDTRFRLPISLIGVTFAVAALSEYLRMRWYAPGNYLLPYMVFSFFIMLIVSILPLLGVSNWWQLLGLRSQLYGVLFVAGLLLVMMGLIEHWFFVRQLPGKGE